MNVTFGIFSNQYMEDLENLFNQNNDRYGFSEPQQFEEHRR